MVKEAIATGATTEEAYEKACAMLGVDPADAEFEVLETEEKKRFGLFGGRPAKVRAFIRSTPADAAAEYLRNVLSGMGLGDVNIEIREEEAGAELVLTEGAKGMKGAIAKISASSSATAAKRWIPSSILRLSLQTMWTSLIIALRWTWAITAKSARKRLKTSAERWLPAP